MTWRDNELSLEALAVQGYYDEDTKTLRQDTLAVALRDVFLRKPARSASDDILERMTRFYKVGVTSTELVEAIFPGFLKANQLSDEERMLLKKEPKSHPELEERHKGVSDITTLLWGTMSKTSRSGAVQKLLVTKGLLLVETKTTRNDAPAAIKAATDDHDLILQWYVRPRGDQLVKVSGGVRDDCTMVAMAFEGIGDRMKRELGGSVTTAIGNLLQVATPDFAALSGSDGAAAKAISSGRTKN